jgi:hypothetical protein
MPAGFSQELWLDGCRWIISTLFTNTIERRFKEGSEEFIPLCSELLKDILSNNYASYLGALLKSKILIRDDEYSAKNHICYGYRISTKYLSSQVEYHSLVTPYIQKALVKYRRKKSKELIKASTPLFPLTRWLTENSLIIDKTEALDFLNDFMRKLEKELKKRELKPQAQKKAASFITTRSIIYQTAIESWRLSKGFNIDRSGGRLYSPIVNLPSIFRNFITTAGGEELVSLDIKNSQPFHLLCLLRPQFWKLKSKKIHLHGMDEELYVHTSSHQVYNMFQELIQSPEYQQLNFFHFKGLVSAGKLYEFMASRLAEKYSHLGAANPFRDRNMTKKQFLRLMYFDPEKKNPLVHGFFEEFEKLFPVEAMAIKLLKSRNYKDLPILLQKIEARLLLHNVCGQIFKKNKAIPIYSIHDSLVTTKAFSEVVESTIYKVYKEDLGMVPQLEKSIWSMDSAYRDMKKYVSRKIDDAMQQIHNPDSSQIIRKVDFEMAYLRERIPDYLRPPQCGIFL